MEGRNGNQKLSGNGCNVKITLDAADRFVAPRHTSTLTQLIPKVTIY